MPDSIEKAVEIAAPVSRVRKAPTYAVDFARRSKGKLVAPLAIQLERIKAYVG